MNKKVEILLMLFLYILLHSGCIRDDFLMDITSRPSQDPFCNISLLQIKSCTVDVQVTHDGNNGKSYVIFCSDDMVSSVPDVYMKCAIKDAVYCRNQKKTIVRFLVPKVATVYRIVVCPMSDDSNINFDSAQELLFTSPDTVGWEFIEHNDWQLRWGDESCSKVIADVTGDALVKDRFFIEVIAEQEIMEAGSIEALISEKVYRFTRKHHILGYEEKLHSYGGVYDVAPRRGRIAAFAIGVTEDGLPSGFIAHTEWATIEIPSDFLQYEGAYMLKGDRSKVYELKFFDADSLVISGFSKDGSLDVGLEYWPQDILDGYYFFDFGTPMWHYPNIRPNSSDYLVRTAAVTGIEEKGNGKKVYKLQKLSEPVSGFLYENRFYVAGGEDELGLAIIVYDPWTRSYYVLDYYDFPFIIEKIHP